MTRRELATTDTKSKMLVARGVDELLEDIRPEWQAKSLIRRVKDLLLVDPSSACQRLLNAAIHDLREKIVIAGLDVAQEAANQNGLPQVKKTEDVYEYSTTHTLDLSYHMGLINRPEWRRLRRAYDIRKDLEHEDDQYEAGIEDCVYVFQTCVEIVLSKDPISPVRVTDIKEIIESPVKISISKELIEDFEGAPDKRQNEICKFLISTARNTKNPDIIRQNSVESLRTLQNLCKKSVKSQIGQHMQEILRGKAAALVDMKVAGAAGVIPYLKQARVKEFFDDLYSEFKNTGYRWTKSEQHRKLLDDLEDIGGLDVIPTDIRKKFVLWMVLCYIGEPGGYGMGVNRPVFYSNSASPRIEAMFKKSASLIEDDIKSSSSNKIVKAAITDKHIARRLDKIRDIVDPDISFS